MLPSHAAQRLHEYGTGNHADRDSETIQTPLSAAGNLAEIGRTRTVWRFDGGDITPDGGALLLQKPARPGNLWVTGGLRAGVE